jgi:electron transport complex protein RnfA
MHLTASSIWSVACTAILFQNVIFVLMLCSSDYFKAVNNTVSGFIYGAGVMIFTTLASALAYPLNQYILIPNNLKFLSPFAFVFVLCFLEVLFEISLLKFAPKFRKSIGKLLPASAFNCAVLGLVLLNVQTGTRGLFGTVFYGFCAGLGFVLAFFIISKVLERASHSSPPAAFRGLPIALVTASIISLGFMGFSNIQIPY